MQMITLQAYWHGRDTETPLYKIMAQKGDQVTKRIVENAL